MSREVMQQALEALKGVAQWVEKRPDTHPWDAWQRIDPAIIALRQALAEPEQEPVGQLQEEAYGRGQVMWFKKPADQSMLYTAPPQREHVTEGSLCWCNPDVIEEAGGNVIVHNYDDNWQQYAKPGETAQQCIERHRSEQDALMKLYATPRKPPAYAGVTAWIGDATVTYCVTQAEIQHERVTGMSMEAAAEMCLKRLAAHGITGGSK